MTSPPRLAMRAVLPAHLALVTLLLADAAGHYAANCPYGDLARQVSATAGAGMLLTSAALAFARHPSNRGAGR